MTCMGNFSALNERVGSPWFLVVIAKEASRFFATWEIGLIGGMVKVS